MAHFYGTAQGGNTAVTRLGTKDAGMRTTCASWAGAVQCTAYVREDKVDCVLIEKIPWRGVGEKRVLYDGPIGKVEKCDRPRINNNPHFADAEKREAG